MRWVDRGPEPAGVSGYARQFTQGWIDHYSQGRGQPPSDSYWREFLATLGGRTNNICWYCERQCQLDSENVGRSPTVDHFRPRSIFPHLVYSWENWVFSCHRCNVDSKQDKWPDTGYVEPCAEVSDERPENYFDYDANTGEIVPRKGLSTTARGKSSNTIDDLGLNLLDVIYYRLDWTRRFTNDLLRLPATEQLALIDLFVEQPVEYAGVTGMVVEQLRKAGSI